MKMLEEAPELEFADEPERTCCRRSPHILMAGDLLSGRILNSLILSHAGYLVDQAADGLEGWQMARSKFYDLIVVDTRMHGPSGLEFLEWIRGAGVVAPVVLISDTHTEDELRRHLWLEVGAVLPPPFTAEQLLETVAEVLRSSRTTHLRARSGNHVLGMAYHHRDTYRSGGINE